MSCLYLFNCTDSINSPVVYGDIFVFDTLDVSIVYDDTPGFKYPMMRHTINSVAHLIENGQISTYQYICEANNISGTSHRDCFALIEPGYRFRYNFDFWKSSLLEPNSSVNYSLTYTADIETGSKTYVHTSSSTVTYYDTGATPEQSAAQLTGPENRNYRPAYSPNGNGYIIKVIIRLNLFLGPTQTVTIMS